MRIEDYSFGRMRIDGRTYEKDLLTLLDARYPCDYTRSVRQGLQKASSRLVGRHHHRRRMT